MSVSEKEKAKKLTVTVVIPTREMVVEALKKIFPLVEVEVVEVKEEEWRKTMMRTLALIVDLEEREKFRKPCLLNGKPGVGYCTEEKLYKFCQDPDHSLKNNWMCWRDGILKEEEKPKEE